MPGDIVYALEFECGMGLQETEGYLFIAGGAKTRLGTFCCDSITKGVKRRYAGVIQVLEVSMRCFSCRPINKLTFLRRWWFMRPLRQLV